MNTYLIVGLGNIGEQYAHTRHNIGFDVLDYFVEQHNQKMASGRLGDSVKFTIKNLQVVCLKPNTYVNLSGKSVLYYLTKHKIDISKLLILVDDLSIPMESLRLKEKGGSNGHNGLKNIEEILQTANYTRLKFGIGDKYSKGQQVDFVLGKWDEKEKEMVTKKIKSAKTIIECWLFEGFQKAAHLCNNMNFNIIHGKESS